MLNIKEFDGKNAMKMFARKFPIEFHLTIFTENAFRLNPQPKRRDLFSCDARYLGGSTKINTKIMVLGRP